MNGLISQAECYPSENKARRLDITIEENLDEQIVLAEKHLAELRAAKERLAATGLLSARIQDLAVAMRY